MPTLVATYALYVDWNNSVPANPLLGFFDAGEDISADWITITIDRGFSSPLARFPSVGRMTVLLKNAAKTYSPPATAAARPRVQVVLQMTYGGTTVTLFRGWIESIRPAFGTKRSRQAVMECVDAVALLDTYEGDVALATNTRAGALISSVVNSVYTPPAESYATGINLYPISGDRWSGPLLMWSSMQGGSGSAPLQRISASGKIEDAARSDWGRFYVDKSGFPTYIDRHQMPFDSTTALTLDDDMVGLDYEMGVSEIYNVIEVTCYPRSLGTTYEVLSKLDQSKAPMIEDGGTLALDLRFRDPSNNAVTMGGRSVITPVAGTDYTCTTDEAGETADISANVSCDAVIYGDHAVITLTAPTPAPVTYVQSLRIRGLAVRSLEPITVIAEDATSQAAYQVRRLRIDAPLMSSQVDAQSLANYLLSYYKDPRHDIRGVEIFANANATLMAAVRDLELCDKVVLTESQTGLSAQAGFIYAMHHTIEPGRIHRLSFDLEQAYSYGADPLRWDAATWDGTEVWVY